MGVFSWIFGSGADEPPVHTPPPIPPDPKRSDDVTAWILNAQEVDEIARRYEVSARAIETLATAMSYSRGRSAQFSHPELGGQGQWMSGGMLMIGDMFNNALKAKVDMICRDVASAIASTPRVTAAATQPFANSVSWWPAGLGTPSTAGAQNFMRYAFFPAARRLVIDDNGAVKIYDTGEQYLTGVSQQQSGSQSLSFTNTRGRLVDLSTLTRIS